MRKTRRHLGKRHVSLCKTLARRRKAVARTIKKICNKKRFKSRCKLLNKKRRHVERSVKKICRR